MTATITLTATCGDQTYEQAANGWWDASYAAKNMAWTRKLAPGSVVTVTDGSEWSRAFKVYHRTVKGWTDICVRRLAETGAHRTI